jgi:hypothetical protein|tara:strand:+ start:926 stop:1117 length:192 start_codon:yes stop_codon:yes gene_type:complete
MSKNIIAALRSISPYLKEEEVVSKTKGIASRSTPDVAKAAPDPKQNIANYVKIIRQQRNTNGS